MREVRKWFAWVKSSVTLVALQLLWLYLCIHGAVVTAGPASLNSMKVSSEGDGFEFRFDFYAQSD